MVLRKRIGKVSRKTGETDIRLTINLDGKGKCSLHSELPFLNHMLTLFCQHGFFDLELDLQGDIEVGAHHSLEDLGICLGRCVKEALGDRSGIRRYGFFLLPMDEALIRVVLDLSGRGRIFFHNLIGKSSRIGQIDGEDWQEFFTAFACEAGCTLHIDVLKEGNMHHMMEGIFKAFARTLDQAIQEEKRLQGNIPSTKGMLA